MPKIWLPNGVVDHVIQEAHDRQEAARALEFAQRLKDIDANLDCFLASETTEDGSIKAGYYYIRRRNPDGTVAIWEISAPDGSFMEPQEAHLEAFRRFDAGSRDVWREIEHERLRREGEAKRERARKEEERRLRLKEEADYAFRVQAPVSRKIETTKKTPPNRTFTA